MDAADVDDDRARLLWPSAFPEHETSLEIRHVQCAKFLDGDCLVVEVSLLGGIVALRDPAELDLRLQTGRLRGPNSVKAYGVATRATTCTILDDVASLA